MPQSVRMRIALAIALVVFAVSAQGQQPAPTPAVDPGAVKTLIAMAAYLRNLKSFQVESVTTTDEVLCCAA